MGPSDGARYATFDDVLHTSTRRCKIAVWPLSRMVAEQRKPDALDAFPIARRWFTSGRRIEMRELAAELGVNRATLFRWVGSRDDLLAEILWSLAEPTLTIAVDRAPGSGRQRI